MSCVYKTIQMKLKLGYRKGANCLPDTTEMCMQNTNSKGKFVMTINEGRRVNLKPVHQAWPQSIYMWSWHIFNTVYLRPFLKFENSHGKSNHYR
jgi:hypothetical protein